MLDVKNLSIEFSQYDGKWKKQSVRPVRDLSLNIQAGEIVAVIGSSGSGKSLLAHAILGLLPHNARLSGEILFKNEQLDGRRIRTLRGKEISLIPQSVAYLNPLARVGKQVFRAARLSGKCCCTASESTNKAFSRYKLQDAVKSLFPFQVSGGMARRVLTATATAGDASLLIADEPTTGLDPRVAKQSLSHLRELADSGKSVMLISHDLDAVLGIADRVAVIYAGTTVEVVPAASFKDNGTLMHPYTRALWSALPQQEFTFLKGNQPKDFETIEGCIFHSRCPQGTEQCRTAEQPLRSVGTNQVRCCRA
ncbi:MULTISPECIES: ABC transporter ATP-binding protein [unclassified Pseudodesulfovibrio]|uniref:ABC transporter ATP-binding protein n=1 Tax=unclassified Pseudodesulfovibrio TaxID=2661612 RepID=UPI000FEB64E1|nr:MULTISPECIES: ABC transporter ATP-binding protein [unclassified Pseudodesulfovibrio]MCJ2164772.1 ABC transporter ATP-binding protein [Pseudodesulfovibrio sp. S3-i]RWU04043.1 ABC transporter ATP-binding protein [Pseudodesulfovibrio sp. S3]